MTIDHLSIPYDDLTYLLRRIQYYRDAVQTHPGSVILEAEMESLESEIQWTLEKVSRIQRG
jgi:hypothetical protein